MPKPDRHAKLRNKPLVFASLPAFVALLGCSASEASHTPHNAGAAASTASSTPASSASAIVTVPVNAPLAPREPGPIVALTPQCALFRDGRAKCWVPNPEIERAEGLVAMTESYGIIAALDSKGAVVCPRCSASSKQALTTLGPLTKVIFGLYLLVQNKAGEVFFIDRDGTITPEPNLNGATELAFSASGTRCGVFSDKPGICVAGPTTWYRDFGSDMNNLVDIAATMGHTCGVRKDGTVYCWGNHQYGALGRGAGGPNAPVEGIDDAIDVVTDGSSPTTCAVRKSGKLTCWGVGEGLVTKVFEVGPVDIPLDDVDHLAASRDVLCASTRKGEVHCFGNIASDEPKRVIGLKGATSIGAANGANCALVGEGELHCWGGWMESKQNLTAVRTPRLVHDVRDAVHLAMTSSSIYRWDGCVARKNKRVLCWLGERTQDPGLEGIVRVAVGKFFACGLHENGKVSCFNGKQEDRSPVGVENAIDIALSSGEGCIVDKAGSVFCWKDDSPTRRAKRLDGMIEATSLKMGYDHGCAIKKNGKLSCWGSNLWRQVSPVAISHFDKPTIRNYLTDVLSVSLAYTNTCALSKNGFFGCWGWRNDWKNGVHVIFKKNEYPETTVTNMTSVTITDDHGCFLENTGEVLCWGKDDYGQLGQGGGFVGLRRVL